MIEQGVLASSCSRLHLALINLSKNMDLNSIRYSRHKAEPESSVPMARECSTLRFILINLSKNMDLNSTVFAILGIKLSRIFSPYGK
jgi:hypothetical protein